MPEFMENGFETVGRIVGRRPYHTIAVATVMTLILISGWLEARERGAGGKAVGSPWRPGDRPQRLRRSYVAVALPVQLLDRRVHGGKL